MSLEEQLTTEKAKVKQLESKVLLLEKANANYAEQYDTLQKQIKDLLRHRFGSRSERFIDSNHPQNDLFCETDLPDTGDAPEETLPDNVVPITGRRKKGKKKGNPSVPHRTVIIELADDDKYCTCGALKDIITHRTCEYLNYIPPVIEIVEEQRQVGVCPDKCNNSIVVAPKPKNLLPKVGASATLLAHIVVAKLIDRQPFYHQEKYSKKRLGVELSRTSMCHWFIAAGSAVQPILNLLKDSLFDYDVAYLDPTWFQVLKEPDRDPTTKSFAYCFRGGAPGKEVTLFEYNASEHISYVRNWFQDYTGYVHGDADNFFAAIVEATDMMMVNCNAHSRRKYESIAKAVTKHGVAYTVMQYYKKLYAIERKAKKQNMTPEQRYALRLAESKPELDKLHDYLVEIAPTVLPKSSLGTSIAYTLNHWEGLTNYLKDGRLEFDNNGTERENKSFAMARKNYLFADTVEGAIALCNLFSIVRTAILHDLDPYQYLVTIFEQLPYCETLEDYERLLPWNINLNKKELTGLAA